MARAVAHHATSRLSGYASVSGRARGPVRAAVARGGRAVPAASRVCLCLVSGSGTELRALVRARGGDCGPERAPGAAITRPRRTVDALSNSSQLYHSMSIFLMWIMQTEDTYYGVIDQADGLLSRSFARSLSLSFSLCRPCALMLEGYVAHPSGKAGVIG